MKSNKQKRLFIIGNGTSVPNGSPLLLNFLYESYELVFHEKKGSVFWHAGVKVAKFLHETWGLKNYVSRYLEGTDENVYKEEIEKLRNVNIEEILTFVEEAVSRGDKLQKGVTRDFNLNDLKKSIHNLIFLTLCEKLKHSCCFNQSLFLENWIIKKSVDNIIVSMNYDILLDNALEGFKTRSGHGWNYAGIETFNFPIIDTKANSTINYFKPHGSLNWLYCPNCKKIDVSYGEKIYYDFVRPFKKLPICHSCNQTTFEPFLIPPVWNKHIYKKKFGNDFWELIKNHFENATSIFFVGYSLPESDMEIRYAIKAGLCMNSDKPKVVIVEPKNEVRQKIIKFLAGNVSLAHEFNSFERFSQANGSII